MSARLVNLVLLSALPTRLRFVAVVMAHHAEPDGSRVFPSVARVAQMMGLTSRAVRLHLAALRRLGVLVPVGTTLVGTVRYRFIAAALPSFGAETHDTPTTDHARQPTEGDEARRLEGLKPPSAKRSEDRSENDQRISPLPFGHIPKDSDPDLERAARLALLDVARAAMLRVPPRDARRRRVHC